MTNAAYQSLEKKLAEAFAQQWDANRATRVEIVRAVDDAAGLRFSTQKSDGSWAVVHEEPPIRLATETDADDLLARGLSIFLMKHPAWPT